VRRRRKVDIVALVYSLVLGSDSGERRTLTGLRRAYQRATGVPLAPSSFYARFTGEFVELMARLANDAVAALSRTNQRRAGVFKLFVEVLAIDSTLIRLHDALEESYPSVWRNHTKASAKIGMVSNVVGRGPKSLTPTHGSRLGPPLVEPSCWEPLASGAPHHLRPRLLQGPALRCHPQAPRARSQQNAQAQRTQSSCAAIVPSTST